MAPVRWAACVAAAARCAGAGAAAASSEPQRAHLHVRAHLDTPASPRLTRGHRCPGCAADLGNPYSNGLVSNCWEVFCSPIPPRWGRLGLQQRAEAGGGAAGGGGTAEAPHVQQAQHGEGSQLQMVQARNGGGGGGGGGVGGGGGGRRRRLGGPARLHASPASPFSAVWLSSSSRQREAHHGVPGHPVPTTPTYLCALPPSLHVCGRSHRLARATARTPPPPQPQQEQQEQ